MSCNQRAGKHLPPRALLRAREATFSLLLASTRKRPSGVSQSTWAIRRLLGQAYFGNNDEGPRLFERASRLRKKWNALSKNGPKHNKTYKKVPLKQTPALIQEVEHQQTLPKHPRCHQWSRRQPLHHSQWKVLSKYRPDNKPEQAPLPHSPAPI